MSHRTPRDLLKSSLIYSHVESSSSSLSRAHLFDGDLLFVLNEEDDVALRLFLLDLVKPELDLLADFNAGRLKLKHQRSTAWTFLMHPMIPI